MPWVLRVLLRGRGGPGHSCPSRDGHALSLGIVELSLLGCTYPVCCGSHMSVLTLGPLGSVYEGERSAPSEGSVTVPWSAPSCLFL